ncbi:hypothetical protein SKAU_G00137570 [Synaphobranchus kaupii]|uniref:Uncharacterized protein n=1 Tax=Synaphobranchus kaupii TaxID=118154 RepID=A0A9Q1J3N7_SYNKA|nr:hypothetical protein SKAU_G00137570 [Synaphobranchus kaupii]
MYLGEDVSCLIKEYLVVQKDEAELELAKTTMGLFVLREKQGPLCEPVEIGIIIDGVEVLSELSSVASACAMLFGLIYSLDLKYPDELKYSFETFQKIVMDIESRKMSKRVVQKDEAELELAKTTMGLFVLREKQGPLCEPVDWHHY